MVLYHPTSISSPLALSFPLLVRVSESELGVNSINRTSSSTPSYTLSFGRPHMRPGFSLCFSSNTPPTVSTHCRRVSTSCFNCSFTVNLFSSSGPNPSAAGQGCGMLPGPFPFPFPAASIAFFFFFPSFGPSFFCSLLNTVDIFLSIESRRSRYSWCPRRSRAMAASRSFRFLFVATIVRRSRCACRSAVAMGSSTFPE